MGKIQNWSDRLRRIDDKTINDGLLKIISATQSQALDLNTAQLQKGLDSADNSIKPMYSPAYAKFKGFTTPDLFLTGGFYRGFFARTDRFPVEFDSTDYKTPVLTEKYGNNIFGLDKKDKAVYADEIKPEVQKLFRDLLSV